MWFYCLPHVFYHFSSYFPRSNKRKVGLFLTSLASVFLIPQLVVLFSDDVSHYCDQPLLAMLVVCIVMTLCNTAFTFLLTMMDPIPWQVTTVFHFFGLLSIVVGMVLAGTTLASTECDISVPSLYLLSVSFTGLCIVSSAFFLVCIPFWIINALWPDSVLDLSTRSGVCYEPVTCCPCLWHA